MFIYFKADIPQFLSFFFYPFKGSTGSKVNTSMNQLKKKYVPKRGKTATSPPTKKRQ